MSGLNKLLDSLKIEDIGDKRFWTLYRGGIQKMLITPRQAVQLLNSLYVTIPGLLDEVNLPDFIAMEACRLFEPDVYHIIRQNKDKFSGYIDYRERELKKFHDDWIGLLPTMKQDWLKKFLMELFPKLEYAWQDMSYGERFASQWRRELRVCSSEIFDVYFRFSIPQDMISAKSLQTFIDAANSGTAKEILLAGVQSKSIAEKNRFWSMLERIPDHVQNELTPDGAKNIFLDFLTVWAEYVGLPDAISSNWLLDYKLGIVHILSVTLKRCQQVQRSELLMSVIKKKLCPDLVMEMLWRFGWEHGKFGGKKSNDSDKLFSLEDYEALAQAYSDEIQGFVDAEAISDSSTLAKMIYFVSEIARDRLKLLVDRLRESKLGLISIISFGSLGPISFGTSEESPQSKFTVNLASIGKLVNPKELIEDITKLLTLNELDGRSLAIANAFVEAYGTSSGGKTDLADDNDDTINDT